MGIKNLSKTINDYAENAIKEQQFKSYFGRKVAIDASMTLYQFLIAIRQDGPGGMLTDENGATTSHLNGLFYRTIRMLEAGIKPVYVFDGKPPEMKSGELQKRTDAKNKAREEMEKAKEEGDLEAVVKFEKRLTRVTKEQNQEAMKLLRLMGVPVVEAPCEAEAQCAELCKAGKVYATCTEDMDALTFGTPILVRRLTSSIARQKKEPIHEYNLKYALEGLDMDMDTFIDLCIMSGCDYTKTIRGIGPKKAYAMLQEHKNIEGLIENLDKKRYPVPEDFLYDAARRLFKKPEVTPGAEVELKWEDPDSAGVLKFMVDEKGFNQARIESGLKRLGNAKKAGCQKRLESFFGAAVRKPNMNKNKRKGKGTKGKGAKKQKTRR